MYDDNAIFTLMKKYRDELLIAAGGVLLFILTLFLLPIGDDWGYWTSPRVQNFSLANYRRLCDVLIGMFLQSHPSWFPMLNRVLIVASHTVCALLFYKIALNLKAKPAIALCFALVFCLAGNSSLTAVNYDCFNQTGTLMFGVAGIYFFLKAGSIHKKFIVYFVFCVLAICVKESGIVYFAILPLFGVIKDIVNGKFDAKNAVKTLSIFYIPGFICALAYYFSPIIQSQKMFTYSGTSPYTPLDYAIGIVMRLAFSYSQTSLVEALKSRDLASMNTLVVTLITFLLSLPLLTTALRTLITFCQKKDCRALTLLLLIAASVIIFAPTLLATPYGTSHTYNGITFFAYLALCAALSAARRKTAVVSMAAFTLAAVITGADIYLQDFQTSARQAAAIRRVREKLVKTDVERFVVYDLNIQRGKQGRCYPVALYTMQQVLDYGDTLVAVFGWNAKGSVVIMSNEAINVHTLTYKPVYFDLSDAALLQHAQEEARNAVNSDQFDVALVLLPTDEFYLYQ